MAAVAVAAGGYLVLVDPNRPGRYPSCPILWLTGHWCPGCGGLRALHALLHGQVSTALSANLVVVLLVPVTVGLWLRWVLVRADLVRAGARRPGGGSRWFFWSLLVVVVAFWGLRNLSATAWLAP